MRKSNQSDVKTMINLLKDMDDNLQMVRDLTKIRFTELGYSMSIINDFARYSEEQLDLFPDSVILSIREKYRIVETTCTPGTVPDHDELVAETRSELHELYIEAKDLIEYQEERDKLQKEVSLIMEDYSAYLSSDKIAEKETMQLEELRSKIDATNDIVEKAKLTKRLKTIEESGSLSFLFTRFEKLGEAEIVNIGKGFFDAKKSKYIMDKFLDKIERFGYDKSLHKSLLDIEANFLGEEYYPFNNLFLYVMVRHIAYADTSNETDGIYVQSLILRVVKMVFHRYKTQEEENDMIAFVKKIDDQFMDFKDEFIKMNDSSPVSEFRINLNRQKKDEAEKNATEWLCEHKIPIPEGISYEELITLMKTEYKKFNLKTWLDMYGIKYSTEASLDELESLRNSAFKLEENINVTTGPNEVVYNEDEGN